MLRRTPRVLRMAGALVLLTVLLSWSAAARWPGGLWTMLLGPPVHPGAAQYVQRHPGVVLAGVFESYWTVERSQRALREQGYAQWRHQRRHSAPSRRYPPYDFDTLEVAGYPHLGLGGRLRLRFFNDRLFEVEFVPAQPARYAQRVGALGLRRDRTGRGERVDGDLRVVSAVGSALSVVGRVVKAEPFVLWQDLRLIRERQRWEAEFGALPRPMQPDAGASG